MKNKIQRDISSRLKLFRESVWPTRLLATGLRKQIINIYFMKVLISSIESISSSDHNTEYLKQNQTTTNTTTRK